MKTTLTKPVVSITIRGAGSLIRELREKKQLQAKQLAEICKIDPSVLSRIENNTLGMSTEVLSKIAVAFKLTPVELAKQCLAHLQVPTGVS